MIWMILLRMFFDFGLKFLKALKLDLRRAFSFLNSGPLKCLRKTSIYRSFGMGERHVAELDW